MHFNCKCVLLLKKSNRFLYFNSIIPLFSEKTIYFCKIMYPMLGAYAWLKQGIKGF